MPLEKAWVLWEDRESIPKVLLASLCAPLGHLFQEAYGGPELVVAAVSVFCNYLSSSAGKRCEPIAGLTPVVQWMPWIKSVTVQPDDPTMSRWLLGTNQFGRDWEFSWSVRLSNFACSAMSHSSDDHYSLCEALIHTPLQILQAGKKPDANQESKGVCCRAVKQGVLFYNVLYIANLPMRRLFLHLADSLAIRGGFNRRQYGLRNRHC